MAHSSLGPSRAKQWINCPGSIALCEKAPPQAPNRAAAEGTVAHDIAEKFITGKIDSLQMMELIGTTRMQEGIEIEIIEEMFDGAVEYKELIDEDYKVLAATSGGAQVHGTAETLVHAKSVDERVWGTADYILFKKGKKLIVYDYKFGAGVIVDPEENEQAVLYLIAVMDEIDCAAFNEMEVVIHQPRGRHADGPVRRWLVPKEWLTEFRARAKAAAAETLNPKALIAAGDWCRWCTAKPFCPTIHDAAQESAMVAFDAMAPTVTVAAADKLQEVRLLSIEKLGQMLTWEKSIKALFEAVKDVAHERLSQGLLVPGWKLAAGRMGNREWIDEDEVVAEFAPSLGEERLYKKELISPAQLEKIVGKKHKLDHLIVRKPGAAVLARDYDPRPSVAAPAKDAFDVVETTAVMTAVVGTPAAVTGRIVASALEAMTPAVDDNDMMAQLGAAPQVELKPKPEPVREKHEPIWPE